MLAALLVAAYLAIAAPEWVEISQQHYKKPVRTHTHNEPGPTFYPADDSTHYQDDIRRPAQNPERLTPTYIGDAVRLGNIPKADRKIYPNASITEHNWNQNKHQVAGNIKRVNTHFKKSNVTPQFSLEIYEPVTEMEPEFAMRNVQKDKESFSATIERVSNKGSVKRVELSNTPVKSPSVTNAVRPVSPIRRNDVRHYGATETDAGFSDEFEIQSDIFKNAQKEVIAMTPLNHEKRVSISTKATPVMNYDRVINSTDIPTRKSSTHLHRFPQKQNTYKSDTVKATNNDEIDSNTKNIPAIKENPISDADVKNTTLQTKLKNMNENEEKIVEKVSNFVTTENYVPEENDLEGVTTSAEFKNNVINKRPVDVTTPILQKQNSDTNSKGGENKSNEELRVNTMESVMNFMKVVAETISKNTRRGINGKVKYLNELKDTLLCTIKDRIDAAWPDDASTPARRRSRSATARGHVEFPSSESSLMTISFLTFAVFLIKLVLQVIHTYKNKAMVMAPLMVATAGRTVRKLHHFH